MLACSTGKVVPSRCHGQFCAFTVRWCRNVVCRNIPSISVDSRGRPAVGARTQKTDCPVRGPLGCSGFSRHSLFSQVLPLPALATTNPKPVSAHAPHPVFYLWGQQLYLQMQQLFPKGKPGSISEVGFSAVNHPFLPLSCLLASSASC